MRTPQALCVYCRQRPIDSRWRPFCSKRCKLADLGRWLSGDYRIPAEPEPEGEPEMDSDERTRER